MRTRRVKLRVLNVPWMTDYHGRDAKLVGEIVDAVEIVTDEIGSADVVAYVDDRDGEASEYAEALASARAARKGGRRTAMLNRIESELSEHAMRRFLHGEVVGVRA